MEDISQNVPYSASASVTVSLAPASNLDPVVDYVSCVLYQQRVIDDLGAATSKVGGYDHARVFRVSSGNHSNAVPDGPAVWKLEICNTSDSAGSVALLYKNKDGKPLPAEYKQIKPRSWAPNIALKHPRDESFVLTFVQAEGSDWTGVALYTRG